MMNLIQLLTDQRAYEGITHSWWGASWNWRWRWVGDDEERRSPSPEPQTDSRSALPRKNRRWRQLHIVKRDELFSLIFFSPNRILWRWNQVKWGPEVGNTPLAVPGVYGTAWWVLAHQGPISGGSWLQCFLLIQQK